MPLPPLRFHPFARPQIWGGRGLTAWGKSLPAEGTYGESWELSGHPLHVSVVADGPHAGQSLNALVAKHPTELFGPGTAQREFPLLIKLLDCEELLSVQVHPSDQLAEAILGQPSGKTEAWIVLSARETARIYAGLKPGVDRPALERALDAGTVAECLHEFKPRVGDCLFIAAGTVHAMGGGLVLAEVQQTSDATFRLFDWNRRGPDGKPRALHRDESLRCINWSAGPVSPVTPQPLGELSTAGVEGESLVRCPYFEIHRVSLTQRWTLPANGWWIGIVTHGSLELTSEHADTSLKLRAGETVLIPASCGATTWTPINGAARVLLTRATATK